MPFQMRVFANQQLEKPGKADEPLKVSQVENKVNVFGEFTELQMVEFYLLWTEGTRVRASSTATGMVTFRRRLENADSDVLADILMTGPTLQGEPYVLPFRVYEMDTKKQGWSGVVNEWQFGRGVVTSSRIYSANGLQVITLLCTDIQLVPHRGKLGNCPERPLTEEIFLTEEEEE